MSIYNGFGESNLKLGILAAITFSCSIVMRLVSAKIFGKEVLKSE